MEGGLIIYTFNDSVEITLKKKNNAGLGWAWLSGVTCSDGTGYSITLRFPCLLWPCLQVIPNSQGEGERGKQGGEGGNGLPPAHLRGSYLF